MPRASTTVPRQKSLHVDRLPRGVGGGRVNGWKRGTERQTVVGGERGTKRNSVGWLEEGRRKYGPTGRGWIESEKERERERDKDEVRELVDGLRHSVDGRSGVVAASGP